MQVFIYQLLLLNIFNGQQFSFVDSCQSDRHKISYLGIVQWCCTLTVSLPANWLGYLEVLFSSDMASLFSRPRSLTHAFHLPAPVSINALQEIPLTLIVRTGIIPLSFPLAVINVCLPLYRFFTITYWHVVIIMTILTGCLPETVFNAFIQRNYHTASCSREIALADPRLIFTQRQINLWASLPQ